MWDTRLKVVCLALICFSWHISTVHSQNPGTPEVDALVKKLRDADDGVRYKASEALSNLAGRHLDGYERVNVPIRAFSDCLTTDKFDLVRANCAIGLYNCGSSAESAIPQLLQALSDKSALVRSWSLRAIGRIGKAALPEIKNVLAATDDPDRLVRRAAAIVLIEMDPERANLAVPILVEELKYWDPTISVTEAVRDEAAAWLKMLKGPSATAAIDALKRSVSEYGTGYGAPSRWRAESIIKHLSQNK